MPSPPHAFSPFLNYYDPSDIMFDIWRGTGLTGDAYFAARNDFVPLIVASQTNNLASVQDLISQKVDLDQRGMEGETALHMAAALGYSDVVKALIEAGASVDITDEARSTPLIHCIRFCPADHACGIASILLSAGASPTHMVTVDIARHTPLWFAIRAHNESLVRLLEPLTPRELDFYPPGSKSSPNYIVDEAILDADEHTDPSIFRFLIQARELPLRTTDLSKASDDQTFSVLAEHLFPSKEEVANAGMDILYGVWAFDRRRLVPALRRLVTQYHLDINGTDVQKLIVTSRSVELVTTAVDLGLDITSLSSDVINDWLDQKLKDDFKSFVLGLTSSP